MPRKYGKKASEKVERALHEMKRGTLRSGSGGKVTSRAQAIAIGLSQARKKGYKVPARSHSTRKKTDAQLNRDITEVLGPASPYQSKYGHGSAEWQSGFKFAKESARHETHAQMREALRQLSASARNDFERGLVAGYEDALGTTGRSHATVKKSARPTPYRLKLSPSELSAVEFARGRYSWADMLAAHATEDGLVAFTESEMWQWTDDVDEDDARFPLAAPAFAAKLERFYESRV